MVCMAMHSSMYVQTGYLVNDLITICYELDEKDKLHFYRSLVFSGTVHWFEGRQAFIHYCGLHQV